VITEAHGIPLAVSLTGSNRNDVTQLMPLIEAIPPVHGRRGRPRRRPEKVYADRGYDHDKYRSKAREKGITPVIARRATEHGSGQSPTPNAQDTGSCSFQHHPSV
jgi:IS5 family transposase